MLERPVLLHVPTGPGCNNRCVFCMEYGRGHPSGRDLEDFERQLERARSFTDEVYFTSGEPTLNRLLPEAIGIARTRGFVRIGLITNGRRLRDGAYCESLLDAGLTELTVSIHGPSAQVHDAVTRRPGSFEDTVAGLANLAAVRPDRTFIWKANCTLVRQNLGHMAAVHALVEGFGVEALNFNAVEPRGRASDDFEDVVPSYAEVLDAADESGLPFDTPRISLSRIPPCAGGLEWIQEDFHFTHSDETTHFDPQEGVVRGPPCEACSGSDRCAGIWERYIAAFGWEGLIPISDPVPESLQLDLGVEGSSSHFRALRHGWLRGHRSLVLEHAFRHPRLPRILAVARALGYRPILARTDGRAIASLGVMRRVAQLPLDGLRLTPGADPRAVAAAVRAGVPFSLEDEEPPSTAPEVPS